MTVIYNVADLPPSLIAAMKWCLTYNVHARPWVRELLAINYLQPASAPLPARLLDKLRPLVSPQEYALLQQALLPTTQKQCDRQICGKVEIVK